MNNLLTFILTMALFTSCGKSALEAIAKGSQKVQEQDYLTTPLQGVVAGEDWVYKSGSLKTYPSDDTKYKLQIWSHLEVDPCNVLFPQSNRYIQGLVPKSLSEVELSYTNNLTLYIFDEDNGLSMNNIVTKGKYKIKDVKDNRATGKMMIFFDEKNKLNGTFDITFCD